MKKDPAKIFVNSTIVEYKEGSMRVLVVGKNWWERGPIAAITSSNRKPGGRYHQSSVERREALLLAHYLES
jgi:hypothetical protein